MAPMVSCCAGSRWVHAHDDNKPNADTDMTIEIRNATARTMIFADLLIGFSFATLDQHPRGANGRQRAARSESRSRCPGLTLAVAEERIATQLGENPPAG